MERPALNASEEKSEVPPAELSESVPAANPEVPKTLEATELVEPVVHVDGVVSEPAAEVPPAISIEAHELELEDRDKEIKQLSRALNRLTRKNIELQGQAGRAEEKVLVLRARKKEVESALGALEEETKSIQRKLSAEQRNHRGARSRLASAFTLLDTDKKVVRWLGTLGRKRKPTFPGKPFVCLGEGPFRPEVVSAMLIGAGAESVDSGSPVEIIVVGRDGFLLDDVEECLRESRGRKIRIYSQEMVVLALGHQCSPFDDASEGLLYHMADGHPGLQAIIEEEFGWPSRIVGPTGSMTDFVTAFAEKSPLKVHGYTTGKTHGLPTSTRQKILAKVFRNDLKKIRGDTDYNVALATWGSPARAKRLRRMAHLLAHLARQAEGKFADYSEAIADWREDLDFMKENFYTDLMRFKWPG